MDSLKHYHGFTHNLYFNVVTQGLADLNKRWNHKDTCDSFNRLYLIIDGQGTIKHKDETIQLKPGHGYLLPRYETYDLHCEDHIKKIWISFDMGILQGHDFFEEYKETCTFQIPIEELRLLEERIASEDLRDLLWCQGIIYTYLSRCLYRMEPLRSEDLRMVEKYKDLFSYIQEHLSFELDFELLASTLGTTYKLLGRDFKKDLGITLKTYVHTQIIHGICSRLIMKDDHISEIAAYYGFKDPFYMSRFFKKSMGISPTQYRQRYSSY